MANVYAARTGVWSATATWNTSALPTINDDVYANNFTVYVDDNFRVISVRNTAATGITAGGRFILNHNVSLSAFAVGGGSVSVACVQFLSAAPFTCTFVGNLSAFSTLNGPPTIFQNGSTGTATIIGDLVRFSQTIGGADRGYIENASSGVLNLSGNYNGGSAGQTSGVVNLGPGTINILGSLFGRAANVGSALVNRSTGIVNITGDVFGIGDIFNGAPGVLNSGSGVVNIIGNAYSVGINNTSTGIVNISGDTFGGTPTNSPGARNNGTGTFIQIGNAFGGTGSSAHGTVNNVAGYVSINGNVVAGTGTTAYGAINNATGYLEVRGNAIGNAFGLGSVGINSAPGIFGSQTGTTIIRGLSCGARGQWPTAGNVFIIPQRTSTATLETSAFQDVTLFTSLSTNIVPPISSVRLGTVYNLGDYRGTCAIPSISSVLQGVAVDNSIGIAALQPQTIWNYSVLSATDVDSLGGRLKEVATVQSVGQQLTALS